MLRIITLHHSITLHSCLKFTEINGRCINFDVFRLFLTHDQVGMVGPLGELLHFPFSLSCGKPSHGFHIIKFREEKTRHEQHLTYERTIATLLWGVGSWYHMTITCFQWSDEKWLIDPLISANRIIISISACTKTRNTETKPPERNHRNRRNHRNTGTKPPKHRNETTETPKRKQRNHRNHRKKL